MQVLPRDIRIYIIHDLHDSRLLISLQGMGRGFQTEIISNPRTENNNT
jgi:hypothetical protein